MNQNHTVTHPVQAYHNIPHNNLGPVLVKTIFNDNNSNYLYKSQIVLLTCAVTGTVHLEIVPNLTMSSLICTLKQIISKRCTSNLSDNGTCFKYKKGTS